MQGTLAIFFKELADHFASKRFIILFLLIYIAGISAIYIAAQTIRSQVGDNSQFVFLYLFMSSGENFPLSFLSFMALFIPILGIALGFDAVNSEKASGNLSRLLSQPVYRDSVINGKFLAGLVTMSILIFSIVAIVGGMGLRMIGVPPTGEEMLRILAFLVVSIAYGAFWLALGILFSVLFSKMATAALASFAIWIFLLIFLPVIAFTIADAAVPLDKTPTAEQVVQHETIGLNIQRISPNIMYGEAIGSLLDPMTKVLNPVLVTEETSSRMLDTPLSFGQSVLLVWPHITSLLALSAICFAMSYIKFMGEEIRSL